MGLTCRYDKYFINFKEGEHWYIVKKGIDDYNWYTTTGVYKGYAAVKNDLYGFAPLGRYLVPINKLSKKLFIK